MKAIGWLALAGLMVLPGCVAPVGPVEVTRFHRPELQAAPRDAIAVVPAPGADGESIEFNTYAAAVRRELQRIGYAQVQAPPDTSAQVAELSISRAMLRADGRRSPVSVGVGGSTGSYGSGLGVGIGIDLSGPPPEQVETQMRVTIRDRATGQAVWEGRASFTVRADSPMADPPLGASRLAEALFKDFPGRSGETIYVR
ncbi:hypothetical protein B2G71_14640 [Novosphingobium sp. PC22D]|uniref:DUF4136 domain-containing protein n=1 Tax=Novosphingobium sp. PC22D TaxID=1962403 RepID=UPI000BF071B8|nr:DUF4136 domain-containing protein [Novosphingobium sp. PC22D]PEQ12011.1 hypothetical protein B2G71_14640 [Novosphingobium sp. PC22D]